MFVWMDGWIGVGWILLSMLLHLLMLDGEVDGLGEVGGVYWRYDGSENIRVHLCLVLCLKVLMTKKILHPVQCQEGNRCRTWECPHDTRNKQTSINVIVIMVIIMYSPLLALARACKLISMVCPLAERETLLSSWLPGPMARRLKSYTWKWQLQQCVADMQFKM